MTLLNDRQIRRLCTVPTFWIHDKEDPSKDPEPMSQPFTQAEYKLVEAYNNRSKGGVDPNRYYLTNADITPDKFKGMIEPFSPNLVKELCGEKVISYGLSSFGYDVTIAPHFKIASNLTEGILDPKNLDERKFVDHDGDYVIIPPMSFVLTHTKEYFRMPKDVKGLVLTKSTYARIGLVCVTTQINPGWEGQLVLEYFNATTVPVKLYAHEGGAEIMFLRGDAPEAPYDTTGKYQGQKGITLPKM